MPQFTGFSKKTFAFLGQLEKNNNREWFEENKQRYLNDVLDPALDFIATIAPVSYTHLTLPTNREV